jgi:hypothetical protein
MHDAREHALVCKALRDGLGGCVEWDADCANRIRGNPDLRGLTPEFIRREVIKHLKAQADSTVRQIVETREEYRDDFRFYYKVIIPVDDFRHGVFVEMRLTGDEDPEYPEVTLFNAHEQRK